MTDDDIRALADRLGYYRDNCVDGRTSISRFDLDKAAIALRDLLAKRDAACEHAVEARLR